MDCDIINDMKINRLIYKFKRLPIKHKHIPNNFYGMSVINLLKEYEKNNNEDIFLSLLNFYFHIKTEELCLYINNMNPYLLESFKSFIQKEISKKLRNVNTGSFLLFLEENNMEIINTLKDKLNRLNNNHVYILELENNNYYVGITTNIERRMKEHITNHGAIFTREHQMVRKIGNVPCIELINFINFRNGRIISEYDCEELVTLCMIDKYGIQNVQGAQYTGQRSRKTFYVKNLNINRRDVLELFFNKKT